MKHKLLLLLIISLITSLTVIMSGGCNKIENLSNSGSRLIVDLVTGRALDGTDKSTTVFSDVITMVDGEPTIENDNASATLRAELLNPAPNNVSNYQDVIVDQIDISYTRSDRPNAVEGKDVPYGFSQRVNFLVALGSSAEYGFMLIQHTAKRESPLVELIYNGLVIKLEANMTFYGKDLAGKRVAPVTTSISVWCADFADPK
ncbi:MAG: hypothetical protein NT166_01195 [Candidatus Aminicenantes bacterium]|nr:hypothetical protein [Candidatus Aminicenantes bacterium]